MKIMKDKVSLAFGLAMIFVGVLALFLQVDSVVIFGIIVASFLLIIIHSYKGKESLLNLLPITILLCFCIFPKTIRKMFFSKFFLTENVNHFFLFATLGFLFIFSYSLEKGRQKEKEMEKTHQEQDENDFIALLSNHVLRQLTTAKLDGNYVLTILTSLIKKFEGKENLSYNDVKEEIEEIQAFLENQSFLNDMKYSLLKKERKNVWILDSLECTYREYTPILEREKVAKMQEVLMGKETKEEKEEDVI